MIAASAVTAVYAANIVVTIAADRVADVAVITTISINTFGATLVSALSSKPV